MEIFLLKVIIKEEENNKYETLEKILKISINFDSRAQTITILLSIISSFLFNTKLFLELDFKKFQFYFFKIISLLNLYLTNQNNFIRRSAQSLFEKVLKKFENNIFDHNDLNGDNKEEYFKNYFQYTKNYFELYQSNLINDRFDLSYVTILKEFNIVDFHFYPFTEAGIHYF
jgi:hypothetical protein